MKTSISKTWLGIGIVTVAMLLASSAATSPVVAASAGPALSMSARTAEISARRQDRPWKPAPPPAASPAYYGRPITYAPAYPPGPFLLFTPFFD